jgi:hypothetical protein
MLECSVCNRLFDDRFTVFVPPHAEPFDRIECARRAGVAGGVEERLAPIVLPTIEAFRPRSEPLPALVGPRLSLAALAVFVLAPGQAALAGGAALFTGGTAASVYLAAKPSPGAPASKPTVRVQSSSASRATSPQVPATSVVTGPPGAFVRERPAGPERASARRRAGRGTVVRHAPIAFTRDEGVAELPPRAGPGEGAAPRRPRQSSTEPQAATPLTAEPTPEPEPESKPKPMDTPKPKDTSEPKPKPKDTSEPKPKPKPKDTSEPKPKPKDTSEPKPKPKDTSEPKPKDTSEPKPKPKDISEPNPPTAKPPTAEPTPAPPEPQPTPPTTSEPPTDAPPNEPPSPQGQNGSHGNGKRNGGEGGGR